jgi:broad specificity phosphatase PhoE
MPVNLVFVRHAQGTHNQGAEIYGDIAYNYPGNIDAILTTKGIRQTTENRLHEKFDAIYCSPLRRCRSTLLGIYPLSETLPVIVDDRIMEQPCGGNICDKRLDKSLVLDTFPKSWNHDLVSDVTPWLINKDSDREKIVTFTEDLIKKHQGQTVLIVSHGTWISRWFQHFAKAENMRIENCKSYRITI